jgi:seryl-tRNA synthetase
MTDLIKQIEELTLRCDSSTLLPVILQVEQLIKERDEARREICREVSLLSNAYINGGRRFIEGTVPDLISSLHALNSRLSAMTQQMGEMEATMKRLSEAVERIEDEKLPHRNEKSGENELVSER